jgi:hypothetical protein
MHVSKYSIFSSIFSTLCMCLNIRCDGMKNFFERKLNTPRWAREERRESSGGGGLPGTQWLRMVRSSSASTGRVTSRVLASSPPCPVSGSLLGTATAGAALRSAVQGFFVGVVATPLALSPLLFSFSCHPNWPQAMYYWCKRRAGLLGGFRLGLVPKNFWVHLSHRMFDI